VRGNGNETREGRCLSEQEAGEGGAAGGKSQHGTKQKSWERTDSTAGGDDRGGNDRREKEEDEGDQESDEGGGEASAERS